MHNGLLSKDAEAILLLCGNFKNSKEKALTHPEYNKIVAQLVKYEMRPSDLLEPRNLDVIISESPLQSERLRGLMQRGAQLAFTIEEWNRGGIWVLCRSDAEYPRRLKKHLQQKAPPILYCAGERSLLSGGGVAIVGSRDVDAIGEQFTKDVAEWSVRQRVPVVSGGARGVDQIAMKAALDAGGSVIGLLADGLLKKSVARESRYAISDGRLLLMSAYDPGARFQVWNAMDRNKHIYAMADIGVIVSTSLKKGGTWEGATEELNRKNNKRPVLVRVGGEVPKGNRALLDLGAVAFPSDLEGLSAEDLKVIIASGPKTAVSEQDSFNFENTHTEVESIKPKSGALNPPPEVSHSSDTNLSVYDVVLPLLLNALVSPITIDMLVEKLEIQKGQLNIWVKRALDEGKLIRLMKPVRYQKK